MQTPKSLKGIVQVNKKNLALGLATLALSIANAPNAHAALINGVTASTDIAPFNASFGGIDNIVNGSGLSSLSLTATQVRLGGLDNLVRLRGLGCIRPDFNRRRFKTKH